MPGMRFMEMKNIFNLLLILVQILLFTGCKNAVTKTPTVITSQKVIKADTVVVREAHEIKFDTILHLSQPFTLNGISLYWEKHIIMADGSLSDIYIILKNYKTKQSLLEAPLDYEDTVDNSDANYDKFNKQSFEDYNFDGFKDASFYLRGSMAMTSTNAIYLFNEKTKSFDLSEELSATEVDVDKKNRIVTASNFNLHSETTKKHHFDKFGKIKYTEVITIHTDSVEYKTYEKIVKGKVVESKVDSIVTE
jgi:hypothetical protein